MAKLMLSPSMRLLLIFVAMFAPSLASHFRYMTVNWQRPTSDPYLVTFSIEQAWRRTFWSNVQLTSSIVTGSFVYGDGASDTLTLSVNSMNLLEDWFIGTATLTHRYPTSPSSFLAYFENCCRISTLADGNNDNSDRVECLLDFSTNDFISPRVTGIPIVQMIYGVQNSFQIPFQAPAGRSLTFSVSQSSQSRLTVPAPAGLQLDPVTGIITWTPTKGINPSSSSTSAVSATEPLFAFQVRAAMSSGKIVSSMDFIFKAVSLAANLPPYTYVLPGATTAQTAVVLTAILGQELVFDVVGVDPVQNGLNNRVLISHSALPSGAILLPCAEGTNSTGFSINPNICTRRFRYTPQLGALDFDVLVKATDGNGLDSASTMRVTIRINNNVQYIYLSGIVRYFASHPDFNKPISSGDDGRVMIANGLDANGKPIFITTAGSTTIQSASSFSQWWNTIAGVNTQQVFSITLSNATSPKVFSFNSLAFLPNGPSAPYFSYEVHTYITYNNDPSEVFTYQSSDDLWVYVNGVKRIDLGGIHALKTGTMDLRLMGLTVGKTYALDFFYAHRGNTGQPGITVQTTNAVLCNVLSSGFGAFALTSFSASTPLQRLGNAAIVNGALRVANQLQAFFTGVAWYQTLQKVLNGFSAKFTFRIQPAAGATPQGFAFVLQRQDIGAQGGAGNGLGYFGITNSIAIEFDTRTDILLGDPSVNHVSVHTRYELSNDPSETYSLANGTSTINFADGVIHTAQIDYVPAKVDESGQNQALIGWIRVYLDNSIVPTVSAPVEDLRVRAMFNGAAFVGFTGSTSDTDSLANIDILTWSLSVVPPSALYTSELAQPPNFFAGNTSSMSFQARDACRNPIKIGGDGSSFTILLTHTDGTQFTTSTIIDNNNGTYTMQYAPRKAGQYNIAVTFGGTPLANSPYQARVFPGDASPLTSTFSIPAGPFVAGNSYTITITARDAFSNLLTVGGSSFSAAFSPAAQTVNVTDNQDGTYRIVFIATSAIQYQVYVRLNGQDIVGSPGSLSVIPAAAFFSTSQLSGNGLFNAIAGLPASFTLTPRDRYRNAITTVGSPADSITGTLNLASPATTVTATCTFSVSAYTCTYTPQTAGTYTVNVRVNSLTTSDSALFTPIVRPGAAVALTSRILTPVNDGTPVVAGSPAFAVVQTYDAFNNIRDSVMDAGSVLTLLVLPNNAFSDLTAVMRYDGSGRYRTSYTPTLAKFANSHNISAVLKIGAAAGQTLFNGQTVAVSVSPGPPDAAFSTFTTPVATVIAGVTSSYIITSADKYGNLRTAGGDAAQFDVTILRGTVGANTISKTDLGANAQYRVDWRANAAGVYTHTVRLFGTSLRLVAPTTTVVPNVTFASTSTVTGLLGGVENSTLTANIQARDFFSNAQVHTSDSFRAFVMRNGFADVAASVGALNPATLGQYELNYTIPRFISGGNNTFAVRVELLVGGQWVTVTRTALLAIIQKPTLISNARAFGIKTGRAGVQGSFYITDFDQNNALRVSVQVFRVLVRLNDQGTSVAIGDPSFAGNGNYTVLYNAAVAGTYRIRIFWQLVQESEFTKSTPYTLVVTAGDVNALTSSVTGLPATVAAGDVLKFNVTLRDSNGNINATSPEYERLSLTYVSSSGTPTLAVVNPINRGVYEFSVYPTKAETAQAVVNHSPAGVLSGLTYNIFVVPGSVKPDQCSAAGSGLTSATAGQPASFAITLKDIYGNKVSATSAVITVKTSRESALAFSTALQQDSTFLVTYTPTLAGNNLNLYVYLDNDPASSIQSSPFSVNITAADVDGPTSFISGMTSGSAGQSFSFFINARDVYGNKKDGVSFRIKVQGVGPAALDSGEATVIAQGGGSGIYTVSYLPRAAGNYSFTYTTDSGLTLQITGNRLFTVFAGPTDPSRTLMPNLVDLIAGTSQTFHLDTRDRFDNYRLQYGDVVQVRFVRGVARCGKITGADQDSPPVDAPPLVYVDNLFSYQVANNINGGYDITFSTRIAQLYSLNVTINGKQIQDCNSFRTLNVRAASSNATASLVVPPASQTSAQAATLVVIVRDSFGNPVLRGNDTVRLGVSPVAGIAGLPAPSTWVTDGNSFLGSIVLSTVDLLNGNYTITYSANRGGLWPLIVTVNGLVIPGPYNANVTAGLVYSFNVPSVGGVTAAIPASFDLSGVDKFGNAVATFTHTYTTRFVRQSGQDIIQDYRFQVGASPKFSVPGTHTVSFTTVWHGGFDVTSQLQNGDPFSTNNTRIFPISAAHATCAFSTPSTPYRCPHDRTCVASYATCADGGVPACSGATPFACPADGVCYGSMQSCSCPNIANVRCADGSCVLSAGECPQPVSVCPSGYIRCNPSGACRKDASECPASPRCPSFLYSCPDGFSCARSSADCPNMIAGAASCPTYPHGSGVRCPGGYCVRFAEDCPTIKTCGTGKILCSDGSCQASADKCPPQYLCYAPNLFRCPGGSCRRSRSDCPTEVTCPLNWVKCEHGRCAPSLSQCGDLWPCALNQTRCLDGSCRDNLMLCPTPSTCPSDAPVKCADGTCAATVHLCSIPSVCGPGRYQCPDGSCATSVSKCTTPKTCPTGFPTLCWDGSCVVSSSSCPPGNSSLPCPNDLPLRCPDRTCRARAADCPSLSSCDAARPVRCADGRCSVAGEAGSCVSPSLLTCPSGYIRCPTGACAISLQLCPTPLTCSPGYVRCRDGGCRQSCEKWTDICPSENVTCPMTTGGAACASSLRNCPAPIVCPSSKPVKCHDASCAASVADCPPIPSDWLSSKYPCPDGAWAIDPGSCGSGTVCPPTSPFRCADGTCRVVPSDCPAVHSCPDDMPIACPSGSCVKYPDDCRSLVRCRSSDAPVLCPNGECVADVSACADPLFPKPTDNPLFTSNACPYRNGFRCRNGACVEREVFCMELTCPSYLPYRCNNGLCTRNSGECPMANGCPAARPTRCADGSCATACTNVTVTTTCQGSQVQCWDGTCASSLSSCLPDNTCLTGEALCHDKTCVSSDRFENYCVSYRSVRSDRPVSNGCPVSAPYRCADGFCAISSVFCTRFARATTASPCPLSAPVMCADGSCRLSADQCPVILQCGLTDPTEVRCSDGSCRSSGLSNACKGVNTCPTGLVRCSNGRCRAPTDTCIDPKVGCPTGFTRCNDGLCAVSSLLCQSARPASGCAGTNVKCPDGSCASSLSQCPVRGCPPATPFRCPNGACVNFGSNCAVGTCSQVTCPDGSCVSSATLCKTDKQCPLSAPIRCADGSCRKYPAFTFAATGNSTFQSNACPATLVCPNNGFLCADFSCVPVASQCRPLMACGAGQKLCSDLTCVATAATCPLAASNLCPPSAPVRCDDGSCVNSLLACTVTSSTTCSFPNSVKCFDGRCRSSYLECAKFAFAVRTGQSLNVNANHDSVCGTGEILCPNGLCAALSSQCGLISACPESAPLSCGDGSCSNTTTCSVVLGACPAGSERCLDGTCRAVGTCFGYNRCPLTAPFFCSGNAQCVASASSCTAVAVQEAVVENEEEDVELAGAPRKLLQTSTTQRYAPCFSNCLRDQLATATEIVMNPISLPEAQRVEIGFDSNGVARLTLDVPSGSVVPSSTAFASGISSVTLLIQPVPSSRLRNTFNYVVPSRQKQFGTVIPYAETVLSTPFSCSVDSNAVAALPIGITVWSAVDRMSQTPPGQTNNGTNNDICFAKLDSQNIWRCTAGQVRANRLNDPAWSESWNIPQSLVRGTIPTCDGSVYAFIQSPLSGTEEGFGASGTDFWKDNWSYVVGGSMIGLVLMGFAAYAASRLYRYRDKYKKQAEKAKELQEVIDDTAIVGGHASGHDDEVAMTANPLVMQMKRVEDNLSQTNRSIEQQRTSTTDPNADRVSQLERERAQLQAELARLKAEMQWQEQRRAVSPPAPMWSAGPASPSSPSNDYSSSSAALVSPQADPPRMDTLRIESPSRSFEDENQPQLPKKKTKF